MYRFVLCDDSVKSNNGCHTNGENGCDVSNHSKVTNDTFSQPRCREEPQGWEVWVQTETLVIGNAVHVAGKDEKL